MIRNLRSAVLVAAVLGVSAAWAGTEEGDFLAAFKKFGIDPFSSISKRPCLCVGGPYNGQAGVLVLNHFDGNPTPDTYECITKGFTGGVLSTLSYCVQAGGSVIVLSK